MNNSLKETIQNELKENLVFKEIFDKFELPKLNDLEEDLDLIYKSNEYMGYYKKELYFDLISKKENLNTNGTLKLTFVSSVKQFDIKKAMHLIPSDETHNISVTFILYNEENDWDTARYNYTLWKNS